VQSLTQIMLVKQRLLATIRAEAPLVFFLWPFVLGQIVAYELCALFEQGGLYLTLQYIGFFAAICIARSRLLSCAFFIGALSMAAVVAVPVKLKVPPGPQQLTLVAEARFHKQGALEGVFRVESLQNRYARCRAVALPWKNIAAIKLGQTISAQASLRPIKLPLNPLSFDATQRRHGISFACKISLATKPFAVESDTLSNMRQTVRARVSQRFGVGEIPGLFLSMVLGVRDTISQKTAYAFQMTGLSHLLVVSGFHITLVFSSVFFIFRLAARKLFSRQPDILVLGLSLSCASALGFVAFVGVDGASLRAGVAAVLIVIGRLLERGAGMLSNIALALFVIAIIWPGCYFEPGVQLTFAALLGIAYGLGLKTRKRWVRGLAVAVFPSVMTLGLTILWFGMLSPASFILNPLLAAPVSFLVTVGGLAALFAFLSGVDSNGLMMSAIFYLLEYFRSFVLMCAEIPYAAFTLEGAEQILLGICALLLPLVLWLERGLRNAIGHGVIRVKQGRLS